MHYSVCIVIIHMFKRTVHISGISLALFFARKFVSVYYPNIIRYVEHAFILVALNKIIRSKQSTNLFFSPFHFFLWIIISFSNHNLHRPAVSYFHYLRSLD